MFVKQVSFVFIKPSFGTSRSFLRFIYKVVLKQRSTGASPCSRVKLDRGTDSTLFFFPLFFFFF